MKRGRGVRALIALALLAGTLTGCGSDSAEVKELKLENENLAKQVDTLQAKVNDSSITEYQGATSLRTVDGTTRALFGTIDGQVRFPNELTIPNGTVDVNDSSIKVGSRFTFLPSSNWLVKMDGTTLHLNHPAKVWGSIKAVAIKKVDSADTVKKALQDFYKGFPATTISYRNVFVADRQVGILSSAAISVDRKDYQVTAGIIERSKSALVVLFVYKEDGTGVQQELIDGIITSGRYSDDTIKID